MNACAGDEIKRVDDELNKTYKLLLSTVKDNQLATTKIRSSRRVWILYRDASVEAMYPAKDKAAEYGSMHPLEFALLHAQFTRRQIAALHDMPSRYQKQTQPAVQ